MSKRVALITGKIRDPDAFDRHLITYAEWLGDGHVDRVVFSGWVSDLHLHGDIIRRMESAGIETVLSREPEIIILGHILHQMKSLHSGLAVISPEDVVLRTRTDKYTPPASPGALFSAHHHAKPPGSRSPFEARILASAMLLFQPYFINDISFVGLAKDLAKMVNSDLWYVTDHALINAEQILHSYPFLASRPGLRSFFKINPGVQWDNRLRARKITKILLDSRWTLSVLATAMADTEDSYTFGYHSVADDHLKPSLTLRRLAELNEGERIGPIRFNPHANMAESVSDAGLSLVLDLPVRRSGPSLRSYAAEPVSMVHPETVPDAANDLAIKLRLPSLGLRNPPVLQDVAGTRTIIAPRVSLVAPPSS